MTARTENDDAEAALQAEQELLDVILGKARDEEIVGDEAPRVH